MSDKKTYSIEITRQVVEKCVLEVIATSDAGAKRRALNLVNGNVERRYQGESQSQWQFVRVAKRPKASDPAGTSDEQHSADESAAEAPAAAESESAE